MLWEMLCFVYISKFKLTIKVYNESVRQNEKKNLWKKRIKNYKVCLF